MEIKIFKFPLSDDFNLKIRALLNSCFKHETQEMADFEKDTHYDTPLSCALAFDDNELIGTVMIFARPIQFLSQNILMGGIGGVCVKEKFKRKGMATILIQEGLRELKKLGCDVAYLGTDENLMKLYQKMGFIKLDKKCLVTGKSGKQYLRGGGMVAPVNSIEKFNLILKSPEVFNLQGGEW